MFYVVIFNLYSWTIDVALEIILSLCICINYMKRMSSRCYKWKSYYNLQIYSNISTLICFCVHELPIWQRPGFYVVFFDGYSVLSDVIISGLMYSEYMQQCNCKWRAFHNIISCHKFSITFLQCTNYFFSYFSIDLVPARFNVAIMMFFACWVNYMMRVNMSVNIIAMVPDDSKTTS